MRLSVRTALAVAATTIAVHTVRAQVGVGASITPYAGYLVTGHWFDGPVGTSIASSNQPMVGAQANIPLSRGVALVSNVHYSAIDMHGYKVLEEGQHVIFELGTGAKGPQAESVRPV